MGAEAMATTRRKDTFQNVLVLALVFELMAVSNAFRGISKLVPQEKLVVSLPFLRGSIASSADSIPNNGGQCSLSVTKINVYTESNLYLRLNYPATTTVFMYLGADIALQNPLNMTQDWSCTSLRPLGNQTYTLSYLDDTSPAVFIWNTSNVFLYGVNIEIPYSPDSPSCKVRYPKLPDYNGDVQCAALHIWNAYGVKVFVGTIAGRVDILRSSRVHIDSLTVTVSRYPITSPFFKGRIQSAVRVMYTGDAINLIRGNVIISNCDLSGGKEGVWIAISSVGVTVRNNYIHNFTFAGVQCGANVQNTADCMLTAITNNLVVTESDVPYLGDAGAIYYDTHWVNPGNYASCNYIIGGSRCYYLDYCSTGIRIDGGLCMNVDSGNKINTGKNNVMTNLIHYNIKNTVGILSCQTYYQNNCLYFPGSIWAQKYFQYYDTPAWREVAPYLHNICSETSVDSTECNPSSGPVTAVTSGNCSGLPTRNNISYILVEGTKLNPPYLGSCENITNAGTMNSHTYINVTRDFVGFNDIDNYDFGVSNFASPIYSKVPGFKSCPLSLVGIQGTATLLSQMESFNALVPDWVLSSSPENPDLTSMLSSELSSNIPQAF